MNPLEVNNAIKEFLAWDTARIAALLTGLIFGALGVWRLYHRRQGLKSQTGNGEGDMEISDEKVAKFNKEMNKRQQRIAELENTNRELEDRNRQLDREKQALEIALAQARAKPDKPLPPPPGELVEQQTRSLAKHCSRSNEYKGVETLQLWRHPSRGTVPVAIISGKKGTQNKRVLQPDGQDILAERNRLQPFPPQLLAVFEKALQEVLPPPPEPDELLNDLF